MVILPGVRCKEYVEGGAVIPEVCCPNPECEGTPLQGHGSYRRRLFREAATGCPRSLPAMRSQPRPVPRGPVLLPGCDVGDRGGGAVGGDSECWRSGVGSGRPSGSASGAQLAAQQETSLGPVLGGAAAGRGGAVVGAGAGGVRRASRVADSPAARSLVEVPLLSRRSARSVPPGSASVGPGRGNQHTLVTAHRKGLVSKILLSARGRSSGPKGGFRRWTRHRENRSRCSVTE
jgi:hypothetical protein